MCTDIHYRFCVKASNSRKCPPPTKHEKCEVHYSLASEIRRGSRQAEKDLKRHEKGETASRRQFRMAEYFAYLSRLTASRQETVRVHYGQPTHDGTCIIDTNNPIINGRGASQM